MAKTFTGSVKIGVAGTLENDPTIGTAGYTYDHKNYYTIASGTAADQANMVWVSSRTLTASSTENLVLTGSLVDSYGATITFTKITGIIVSAAAANTNNVVVGGAATNAFINWSTGTTPAIVVRPGGVFSLYSNDATGYAVTASTGDVLKVANSGAGTSVTYDIILIGCI